MLLRNKPFLKMGEFLVLPHGTNDDDNDSDSKSIFLPTRLLGDEAQWDQMIMEHNGNSEYWFNAPWLFSECYMYR